VRFPKPDTSRLILIGTSDYERETLTNLPAVDNCINTLRDILTASGTGGFLPENCLTPSDDIGIQSLVAEIQRFALAAGDVLVIWFIGHGIFEIDSRNLYLALHKANPLEPYYTALPFEQLKRAFLASDAEVKILMMDCCFSGTVIAEMAMGMSALSDLFNEQVAVEGTYIMTACSGHEVALSPPGDDFTAFTGSVIDALRTVVPLPMGDLFGRVSRNLRGKMLPAPHQSSSGTAADLALLRPASLSDFTVANGITFTINPPDEPESSASGRLGAQTSELGYSGHEHQSAQSEGLATQKSGSEIAPLSPAELEDRMQGLCTEAEAIGWVAAGPSAEEDEPHPELIIARLRQIITDMIQLGKPDHPLALLVRDLYACWLGRAGLYREATRQYSRLVKARETLYGPEHGDVLGSRHNLAHMVGLTGETAAAVSQFELIVEDRRRLLGDRHRDTLHSMSGLAYWTALSGEVLKSLEMYKELYSDDDWLLGPLDEQTLTSLSLLAWVQGLANDAEGARDSYADLADRWAQRNGPECLEARKYTRFYDFWARRVSGEP
jgi:hypothetical protein